MNANELMIGDWVRGFVPEANSTIYGIFNEQRVAIIAEPSKAYIELSIDDIQPIPITPAILEQNGFGYKENDAMCTHFYPGEPHYCADMDFHIGTASFGVYWLNYHGNDIHGLRFVHELQHAFRLCGIEKEVVL